MKVPENADGGKESEKNLNNDFRCPSINRALLPSKIFYFFYFSSWGSLMPYLALYFKEMMLSPSQVGILMGLRPVVNFVFNPIWGLLIDKFNKGKLVLLIALVACISTTFSLSLISPAEKLCKEKTNNFKSTTKRAAINANISFITMIQPVNLTSDWTNFSSHSYRFYMSSVSIQPWPLVLLELQTATSNKGPDTTQLFFHLFFILLFGNVVAAPALTIVDTYTVKKLGDQSHRYGTQRLWGSLGFGLAAFIIGACVSVAHYCSGPFTESSDINYSLCFYSYTILMSIALVVATKFDLNGKHPNEESLGLENHFDDGQSIDPDAYGAENHLKNGHTNKSKNLENTCKTTSAKSEDETMGIVPSTEAENKCKPALTKTSENTGVSVLETKDMKTGQEQRNSFKESTDTTEEDNKYKATPSKSSKSAAFRDQINALKETLDLKFLLILYSAFFFGFLAAFIKTFLFWHLKDVGGTPELFCIIVAVHCVAEVALYFLSSRLITLIGHIKVLYLGFACYFIRCFTYWMTTRPWSVLPIELLAGITSAAVWSAMLSYVGQRSRANNATTMQGLLNGIHWGLGSGSGEMIGGVIVSFIGTSSCFLLLGFGSLLFLIGFLAFNNSRDVIQAIRGRKT